MTTTAYIVNRKWKIAGFGLTILYGLLTLFAVPVYAAFEDKGTGARGTALGDTYASLGDDLLSLAYNPASLARVEQKQITTELARLYTGLSDGSNLSQYFFAYGQRVSWGGTMAFGWKQFGVDDLYKERTLSLGYGEWVTDRVAAGITLKQLYHSFGVPNMIVDDAGNVQTGKPSFFTENGNSNTAYAADLGMLYRWTDRKTIGVSIFDVNEPNVALSSRDHEIVPRTLRASLAYQVSSKLSLAGAVSSRETLSNQRDTIWTGSAERWWKVDDIGDLALRGSMAVGSREYRQLALGAGYRFDSLQLDYAFVFNFAGVVIGDTSGTHRFSLTYRFGPVQPKLPRKSKAKQCRCEPEVEGAATETAPKMPPGYEIPEPTRRGAFQPGAPREVEIVITPEEIEGVHPVPSTTQPLPKAADVSIDLLYDMDRLERCPNVPPGVAVDAQDCQPLPRRVTIEFLPLQGGK
jgi:hypothetical protein